jgi:GTP-binding protein
MCRRAGDPEAPLQMLVSNITYDPHRGRIAIGKIHNGRLHAGHEVAHLPTNGELKRATISSVAVFVGVERREAKAAEAGDIVAVSGIDDITIGETIADAGARPLPP